MNSESRIESLEGQVKTLKRIVYGFGCLFVAGVAIAATSMRIADSGDFTDLTCTSLTVNDGAIKINKAGKMTTKLYSDSGGDGQVELYNSAGNRCAEMYGDSNGDGRLRLYKANGTTAVDLFAYKHGGTLVILNKDETEVANVYASSDGGVLDINNKDGTIIFHEPKD